MDQSELRLEWRSSSSLIFWGVVVLTVFGCAASVFEFFFGIVNAVDNYLGTILDTASSFGAGSHAEGLAKFSAVHDRMSVFTRLFEALTVAGWIVYVVGLSRFRNAQHTERGRWLTGSLYTACWLGLIGMACTFLGSFLGMFGLLFTFAGWVLNLISLFKFRSAFNQLYIEDSWTDMARQGARTLRNSYTFGIILAFFPLIVFLAMALISIGSISSLGGMMRGFSDDAAGTIMSLLGGSIAFMILLGLIGIVLWILQTCYLIAGWCKINDGAPADDPEMDEYPSDHSTLAIICSILGAIAVMIFGAWLCLSPLTHDGSKRVESAYKSESVESETEATDSDNENEELTSIVESLRESGPSKTKQEESEPEGDIYTHHYKGSIDNKYAIEMTLTTDGGAYYTGEYMYVKNKRPIQLSGQRVDDGDRLVLEEYVGDKMTGLFDGILGRSGYSGTWTSADGSRSYPFSVRPN